jgi:zinc protease
VTRPDRQIAHLDCGLVVIAQRVPTAPVVSVQCWVKAGAIYEGRYSGSGISHLLEHVISGGTTSTRTAEETCAALARLGAQTNATTGLDTVHYYIDTAAADAPLAIELMSDWMQHARITQEEFAAQRDVIQSELVTGRGEPGWILWKLTQHARYAHHPARHPTIGYLDELLALTADDVRRFYETMYVPNNMVFVVAGDVDPAQVVALVADQWAEAVPRPVPELSLPVEAPLNSPQLLCGYSAVEKPRLRLAWPGTRLGTGGDHALDVLARVLGQGAMSRLVRIVRDRQRLVSTASAYNLSFPWGGGFFGVDAIPTTASLDDARTAILAQVEQIRTDGVTSDELTRAKRKLVSTEVYSAQTARAAASRMARDFIQSGDPDYLHRYAASVDQVHADEVHDAAVRYLHPDHLITIHLLSQRNGEIEAVTRSAAGDAPGPIGKERVTFDNAPLVQTMRSLAPLATKRVSTAPSPPRLATLPNGLRVILQRNPRLPIVAMQWHTRSGLLADEPGREGVANAVAAMMTRGAGARSADDISRTVEGLGASLSAAFNHSTSSVGGECLAGDWKIVLDLLGDVIQRPRFAEAEWANLRPRILTAITIQNETWHSHLRTAIREAYFDPAHPWSQSDLGRREIIAGLHRDDLARFHEGRLSASDGVLAIFGDINEDELLAEVARGFGEMPRSPVTPLAPPTCGPVKPKHVRIPINKPLAAVQLAYGPGLTRRCEEYAALLVMNKVLDHAPGGWLDQELSGRGLVYALGAGMMAGPAPGYWAMMFSCKPSNTREARSRAIGVVDRIRTELVDEATLERAKTGALLAEALGLQSNAQRATGAALDELMGFGFDANPELCDAIRLVDAESVRTTAVRYLDTLVSVEIGPEAT